jgi:hypothetical protein
MVDTDARSRVVSEDLGRGRRRVDNRDVGIRSSDDLLQRGRFDS